MRLVRGIRVSPEQGWAIIHGVKTVHYLPAPSPEAVCPHKPNDLIGLQFPQLALDSYGQTILDRNGEPRLVYGHEARLRVLEVASEDAGVEGSAVWALTFRLEYTDEDELLARGAGYTSVLALAIDELPVVRLHRLRLHWSQDAELRHLKAKGTAFKVNERAKRARAA